MQERGVKDEFYKNWVAPDGLARLDLEDKHEPFAGQSLFTVNNDNGILFLVYFLLACKELDQRDKENFESAVHRLEVQLGLYNRRPGLSWVREAHDNYNGIAMGALLFDFPFARDICSFGSVHGFMFNNTSVDLFDIRQVHQGVSVAHYKICAGWEPTVWEMFWYTAALMNTMLGKKDYSGLLLCWLRISALRIRLSKTPTLVVGIPGLLLLFTWEVVLKFRFKGLPTLLSNYFRPEHPIVAISRL